jgi:hypothetical protein
MSLSFDSNVRASVESAEGKAPPGRNMGAIQKRAHRPPAAIAVATFTILPTVLGTLPYTRAAIIVQGFGKKFSRPCRWYAFISSMRQCS